MSEYKFKMPRLGESITEAAIIKWFKNVGDAIDQDEVLLEVATDKVDSEVPSLVSGIVTELLFKQNDVISIGETIAIIKTDGVVLPTEKKEASCESKHSCAPRRGCGGANARAHASNRHGETHGMEGTFVVWGRWSSDATGLPLALLPRSPASRRWP